MSRSGLRPVPRAAEGPVEERVGQDAHDGRLLGNNINNINNNNNNSSSSSSSNHTNYNTRRPPKRGVVNIRFVIFLDFPDINIMSPCLGQWCFPLNRMFMNVEGKSESI